MEYPARKKIAVLLALAATLYLSGCSTLAFTPEGVCKKSHSFGTPDYKECVKQTYAQRRAEFWRTDGQTLIVGTALVAGAIVASKTALSPYPSASSIDAGQSSTVGIYHRSPKPSSDPSITDRLRLGASSSSKSPATLCPDGSYVSGTCGMAPDGSYVSGRPTMAPNGKWVGGSPQITPNGSYVEGRTQTMCPDGTYVGGSRCALTPNGTYVGGN